MCHHGGHWLKECADSWLLSGTFLLFVNFLVTCKTLHDSPVHSRAAFYIRVFIGQHLKSLLNAVKCSSHALCSKCAWRFVLFAVRFKRQRWNRSKVALLLVFGTDSAVTGPGQPCFFMLRSVLEQSYSRKEVDALCSCHSAEIRDTHNVFCFNWSGIPAQALQAQALHINPKGLMFTAYSLPPPPKQFQAEHPFMFFLQHTRSQAILFLGRFGRP
uniref:Serpin domain-containing protein n=1 Tax=Timema douglasi TaxID=61478 RepID=A0A7R8VEP4_TIMDO|nr:unnamed protein product [Timema douglasi]